MTDISTQITNISNKLFETPPSITLARSRSEMDSTDTITDSVIELFDAPPVDRHYSVMTDLFIESEIKNILIQTETELLKGNFSLDRTTNETASGWYLDLLYDYEHNIIMHISFHKLNKKFINNKIHIKNNTNEIKYEIKHTSNKEDKKISFTKISSNCTPIFEEGAELIIVCITDVINIKYDKYIKKAKVKMDTVVKYYMIFDQIISLLNKNKEDISNIYIDSNIDINKILYIYMNIILKLNAGYRYLQEMQSNTKIKKELTFLLKYLKPPKTYNKPCNTLKEYIDNIQQIKSSRKTNKKELIQAENNKLLENISYCIFYGVCSWQIFYTQYFLILKTNPEKMISLIITDPLKSKETKFAEEIAEIDEMPKFTIREIDMSNIDSLLNFNILIKSPELVKIRNSLSDYIISLFDKEICSDLPYLSTNSSRNIYDSTIMSTISHPLVVSSSKKGIKRSNRKEDKIEKDEMEDGEMEDGEIEEGEIEDNVETPEKKLKTTLLKYLKYKNKYLQLKKILQQL